MFEELCRVFVRCRCRWALARFAMAILIGEFDCIEENWSWRYADCYSYANAWGACEEPDETQALSEEDRRMALTWLVPRLRRVEVVIPDTPRDTDKKVYVYLGKARALIKQGLGRIYYVRYRGERPSIPEELRAAAAGLLLVAQEALAAAPSELAYRGYPEYRSWLLESREARIGMEKDRVVFLLRRGLAERWMLHADPLLFSRL